jgi:TAT (twin-arginine translocation) pathway-exported protein
MKSMDRRTFLKLAGAGSAAAAVAAIPAAGALSLTGAGRLSFRATAGLPAKPLPAYATQVVEGNIELGRGTGSVTSQVFAGHTEGISDIALPGLSRVIRITDVQRQGVVMRLSGVVDDRSSLQRGESAKVEVVVDWAHGTVVAPLAGSRVTLNLVR